MNEQEDLRAKAAHARRLAKLTTDKSAQDALEAFAGELDRRAEEIEHKN